MPEKIQSFNPLSLQISINDLLGTIKSTILLLLFLHITRAVSGLYVHNNIFNASNLIKFEIHIDKTLWVT